MTAKLLSIASDESDRVEREVTTAAPVVVPCTSFGTRTNRFSCCKSKCNSLNYCCNYDVTVGSNQYISCLQGLLLLWRYTNTINIKPFIYIYIYFPLSRTAIFLQLTLIILLRLFICIACMLVADAFLSTTEVTTMCNSKRACSPNTLNKYTIGWSLCRSCSDIYLSGSSGAKKVTLNLLLQV